ncbi:MAG TPA: PDGLE domain-containing protein [Candidatus Nanoarchaeia archaeon]|nr:PDGLE domain-containing protein [Candidatus Nanoarchaeia archaeon]
MPITTKRTMILILGLAMIFVLVGTFVLSFSFETLDKQADKLGAKENPVYKAPFADYNIPGLDNVWGALIVGVFGTLGLFGLGLGVAKIVYRKKSHVI